ncbi:MAG: CRISPR-associated protein Cas4 [Candidatus Thermoplasmatota archaeon]|nr:CRISPR-associated protein Cas4 [Candidatus Thermoplasmatota archaeon]
MDNKIQDGKIIYSDLNIPEKPFFSRRYRITGKPDYIIKKSGYYIPIEVKSGNHLSSKKNHIYQLMAYCQLLEDNYNCFIPYGILVYNDTSKQFKITYDPKMRFELGSIIKEMRKSLNCDIIHRNHFEIKKCIKCSMRKHCDQKLG